MKTILDSRVGKLTLAMGLLSVGFACGFATCNIWWRIDDPLRSAERHWKEYESIMDAVNNPDEHQEFFESDACCDPEPSLSALAAMGEIRESVVVLPTVPNNSEVTNFWLRYLMDKPDVLWVTGPSYPQPFNTRGEQPLYLRIWYRRSAKDDLQEMIRQLEELTEKQREAAANPPVEQ